MLKEHTLFSSVVRRDKTGSPVIEQIEDIKIEYNRDGIQSMRLYSEHFIDWFPVLPSEFKAAYPMKYQELEDEIEFLIEIDPDFQASVKFGT